jgi:ribonucleoside-diphosphate reductase alpha chain
MVKIGPQTFAADSLHAMKYRSPGEDFREAMNRVAFALKDSDDHYHEFREILLGQRFMPAGRIQSGIGSSKWVTPYNCFVSGTISDSFVDGAGSIMGRAHEAAATMRMGGGIGYDFSTLRPRGEIIAKLQSAASGPVSFMHIFDAVCLATCSSGHRRGAQMGVMRVDHPDIEEFIHAKNNRDKLTGFNISVAITNEFMEAVINEKEFPLQWNGRVYRYVDALTLWENIMRSTFDWAEPGVVFIDNINNMNNLWYAETIATTNPCSEQPLPPFGACLLGSFNLVKYLTTQPVPAGQCPWSFDYDQLVADIPAVIRAMDNVVDKARYPLAEQRAEALTKRRMGIGITGLANAGEALGFPYGSDAFCEFENAVLETININCYKQSSLLAKEKGSFPLFDVERYLHGNFIKSLPEEIHYHIMRYGMRNSHLTSIAPTGTISLTADNVSSALEPVFAYETKRPINTPTGQTIETIKDYGLAFLVVNGKLAQDVTADEHLNVLVTAQKHVDSAVSKTINMNGKTMPWSDFKMIYQTAWENGAKGCSTFNISGKRMALLSAAKEDKDEEIEGGACYIDPETGLRSCE